MKRSIYILKKERDTPKEEKTSHFKAHGFHKETVVQTSMRKVSLYSTLSGRRLLDSAPTK